MYSTWVSECRVPLRNVPPETIGHAPCERTTSSAPIPLRTVTTVASENRPARARAAGSSPEAFVATIATSNAGSASGSSLAVTRAWWSDLPVTRSPCSFSASACSRRRVSTETSHTRARCPAKRLPITPAPTMQTRSITPRRSSLPVTCQSTRTRRGFLSVHQPPELGVRNQPPLPCPGTLHGFQELRVSLVRNVEAELGDLDADRVESALLAEDDASLRADELRRVRLDRRRVVELCGHRPGLTREEVVSRHCFPRREGRAGQLLHDRCERTRLREIEPCRDPVERLERERNLD